MASKSSLYAILFIVLLHLQFAFQLTLGECPTPPHLKAFEPRRKSHEVTIEVDKITKAVADAGYKSMSLVLEKKLRSIIPHSNYGDANNTITIYNHNKITIFVPCDEAVELERELGDGTSLEYQFVTSKVDKEVPESSQLLTLHPQHTLVVKSPLDSEWALINNAIIMHWNIYNDGSVIVHGVNNFFNYHSNSILPCLLRC